MKKYLFLLLLLPVIALADPATENGVQAVKSELQVSNTLLAQIEANTAGGGASAQPVKALFQSCNKLLVIGSDASFIRTSTSVTYNDGSASFTVVSGSTDTATLVSWMLAIFNNLNGSSVTMTDIGPLFDCFGVANRAVLGL